MGHVFLLTCSGAHELSDRLQRFLTAEGFDARQLLLSSLPAPEENVVVLLVLAADGDAETSIVEALAEIGRRRLPLVPIVENLGTYGFSRTPYPEVATRNAVGWQPDDGTSVLEAVRGHLGQVAFPHRKRIFVSYARRDGQAVADALYDYFWAQHYEAFVDRAQIEGGAVVQERIYRQIADKDFLLLVDTPAAQRSDWVRAEIVEALRRRVPVRVLAVGTTKPHPLLQDAERLTWDEAADMLPRVGSFVSQAIGEAATFDERCRRLLAGLAAIKGIRVEELDRRRVRLRRGPERVVLEHERALPTLERLHRLYHAYIDGGRQPALLVCSDQPIAQVTLEAVQWARGRSPLKVLSILDLASTLDTFFP